MVARAARPGGARSSPPAPRLAPWGHGSRGLLALGARAGGGRRRAGGVPGARPAEVVLRELGLARRAWGVVRVRAAHGARGVTAVGAGAGRGGTRRAAGDR